MSTAIEVLEPLFPIWEWLAEGGGAEWVEIVRLNGLKCGVLHAKMGLFCVISGFRLRVVERRLTRGLCRAYGALSFFARVPALTGPGYFCAVPCGTGLFSAGVLG